MELWKKGFIGGSLAGAVGRIVWRAVEAITAEPSPVLEFGSGMAAAGVTAMAVMKGLDYLFPDKEQGGKNSPAPGEGREPARAPSLEPELTPHVSQAVERPPVEPRPERSPTHFREMVARREERQGGREL
jgi:hypothetical protein